MDHRETDKTDISTSETDSRMRPNEATPPRDALREEFELYASPPVALRWTRGEGGFVSTPLKTTLNPKETCPTELEAACNYYGTRVAVVDAGDNKPRLFITEENAKAEIIMRKSLVALQSVQLQAYTDHDRIRFNGKVESVGNGAYIVEDPSGFLETEFAKEGITASRKDAIDWNEQEFRRTSGPDAPYDRQLHDTCIMVTGSDTYESRPTLAKLAELYDRLDRKNPYRNSQEETPYIPLEELRNRRAAAPQPTWSQQVVIGGNTRPNDRSPF